MRRRYIVLIAVASLLPFLFYMIRNNGIYTLADDFNSQILPFGIDMVRTMRAAGPDAFSYKIDLGTSAFLGYTYYGFFSPFFAPAYLFPETYFPYLIGVLFALKYFTACLTSYLFLRRFTKSELPAMIGSVMYAFSGYAASNMQFYFFQDSIALFPLLLLTLEQMIDETADLRKSGLGFSVVVCLCCVTNYFFFVQEVLFLIIYYLFRCFHRGIKYLLQRGGVILLFGILGTGMAAVVFLPNIMYILGSNRVQNNEASAVEFFFPDWRYYLMLLKGYLLPGEALNAHSAVMTREFYIGSVFLPGGGLALVTAYVARKRDWLGVLIGCLFLISFVPGISAFFLLFITDYYRWWFMYALIMTLAAARVLDETDAYPVRSCAVVSAAVIVVFALVIRFGRYEGESLLLNAGRFWLVVLIAIAGTAALLIPKPRWILTVTVAGAIVTTILVQQFYRDAEFISEETYMDRIKIGMSLRQEDPSYRWQSHTNILMLPPGEDVSGTNTYTTTAATALREYDSLFDFFDPEGNSRFNKNNIPGLLSALGARYYVLSDVLEKERRTDDELAMGVVTDTYEVQGNTVELLEFPSSPIAYTTDRYILREELAQLSTDRRGIALLNAALVYEYNKDLLPDNMKAVTAADINALIEADPAHAWGEELFVHPVVTELSLENDKNGLDDFERDYRGFRGISHHETDALLCVSVPIDAGWHAAIDGVSSRILNAGGLMAVVVPAGKHQIVFEYGTPYVKKGLLISAVSVLMWCLLFVWRVGLIQRVKTHVSRK